MQLPGLGKKLLEIRAEVIRGRGFQVLLEFMARPFEESLNGTKSNTLLLEGESQYRARSDHVSGLTAGHQGCTGRALDARAVCHRLLDHRQLLRQGRVKQQEGEKCNC